MKKLQLIVEINRNLEAMARQLYDYWFVQFDFPDENGKALQVERRQDGNGMND